MQQVKFTLPILLVAALLAGCGGSSTASLNTNDIAVVGSVHVNKTSYDALIAQAKRSFVSQGRKFPAQGTADFATVKGQAVTLLVQQAEREAKAGSLGIKITDKNVQARLVQIKKQYFGGSESRYKKQLTAQGLTESQVKDDIKAQLIQEKIFKKVTGNVSVSDADLKKYYDEHQSQYGVPEQRDVAHILVKTKALADKLYKRIKAGEDFTTLAKKYSQDPGSKKVGGKLTISKGQTVGPFDQTAFLLETGHISHPIKTDFGYHIIKALGPVKPAKVTPFSKVKATIKQTLLQQKRNTAMTTWSNKLKKDFDGKISYQTGYAPPATTTTAGTTTG